MHGDNIKKHHLIISGTGRAGTTFLIQLFTALCLETGFSDLTSAIFPNCNAGMEWDIRRKDAPYIVKDPWLCDYLDAYLDEDRCVIDHALIPVRELYSAAESRREVTRRTVEVSAGGTPGGLWHTSDPNKQEDVLAHQLYKIIYTVTKRDIPITLLHFPRFIHDPQYLYEKLNNIISAVSYEEFMTAFSRVVQPELVHEFKNPRVES